MHPLMCFARALVGSRRSVPSDHVGAPPSGEAAKVVFLTAGAQPLVRERVAELVRVQVADAGSLRAPIEHEANA